MTQKSLKARLDHTINAALGYLVSNKDHCSFVRQNTYLIKTRSAISNLFKNCGQVDPDRLQAGKSYHLLPLLNLMTDLCHPKAKLKPSMKTQSQPALHGGCSANSMEKWFSYLFFMLSLNQN